MKFRYVLLSAFILFSAVKAAQQMPNLGIDIEIKDLATAESRNIWLPLEKIKSMPLDSAVTDSGEEQPPRVWYGAALESVLAQFAGISIDRVRKISISAPDGYSSVIYGDLLAGLKSGLFAFRLKNKSNFVERYGNCRLIFPDLRSMYWVNNPVKMNVEVGSDSRTLNSVRLFFLNRSGLKSSVKIDYNYQPYVPVMTLLAKSGRPDSHFRLLSQDGLFREYSPHESNNRLLLKMQPDSSWNLTGVEVPGGLKTRNVFSLITEKTVIFLKDLTQQETRLWNERFLPENQSDFELTFFDKLNHIIRESARVERANVYLRFSEIVKNNPNIEYAVLKW
ncbi:hypothetical protein GF337_15090 [candidate division KSB1 bacterium]|nr:hypothetical protein [candidate division KSB1 bacterium]